MSARLDTPLDTPFCDDWDRSIFEDGVLALFLLNPDGELRLAGGRTRDALRHAPGPFPCAACHALLRDGATGHVHYVLTTSPALVQGHPRLTATCYETQAEALAALAALGPGHRAP